MKTNKAAFFFIVLAYWAIFLGFLTWTVAHYHAIFHAWEIPGPLRDFNSWQIGIVIEGGYALFQFFFMRVRGKSKYFLLIAFLALIYFCQYQYYEATVPVMWKRLIFAAIFPFVLFLFAWMGNKMKELKESMAHGAGGKQVSSASSRYSKEELEILEGAGVNLDGDNAGPGSGAPEPGQEPGQPEPGQPEPGQPEPGQPEPGQPEPGQEPEPQTIKISECQGHSSGTNQPHPRTLMRKYGKPLLYSEDGSVRCQYCGATAKNVQAIKKTNHNLMNCFKEWFEANYAEVNDVNVDG